MSLEYLIGAVGGLAGGTPDYFGRRDRDPNEIEYVTESMADKKEEAIKPLDGKTRYELIPADALEEIAAVLTFGAKKRGENNWTKGQHWSRYIGALLRHTYAFARGAERDIETNRSHLAHAGCCVLFLLAYQLRKIGTDDRGTSV